MIGRADAIGLDPRSSVTLALASIAGAFAFGWPLLRAPGEGIGHGSDAPLIFVILLPILVVIVLAEIAGGGIDSKALAMLGVLSAIGAALRPLGAGTAGIETTFFLLIVAGERGLSLDELKRFSGHHTAEKTLKRLAKKFAEWNQVVLLPGKPHLRYRLLFQ